ncbi:MAG TPA: polyprenyl synthetase family protein [Propionibacteriaceae bacterium]|nr:polyprenyl synthetase family protein [Propionibacteriaceae bacterium]
MVNNPLVKGADAVLDPQAPLSQAFREAVSAEISAFLNEQSSVLDSMGPELVPVHLMASQMLCGGKRMRPAFCVWGYIAAAGIPSDDDLKSLLTAAGSLDVLHVSALIHDDLMDSSDLRRGRPAAHRQFEALHANAGWLGDSAAFGRAGAILLGDLLVMWSAQMLHGAGVDQSTLERALPIVEAMRTEVTCGQYLDIVAQAHPLRKRAPAIGSLRPTIELALDDASRVVEYKAARYTVQRPCQMGAALGGGDDELYFALGAYGSPLGRAFQFRDDLLGVFGDPKVTGKPAGDDLREGKRTVLVAHAYAHADDAGQKLLLQRLGDPALDETGITELQQVIVESGAREAVESMINEYYERALKALHDTEITEEGRVGLTALADAAVRREF